MYVRFYLHVRYSCQNLIKLEIYGQVFEKSSITKYHENPPSGSGIFPCGRTDRRADMTKLIAPFHNFKKVPKTSLKLDPETKEAMHSVLHA